MRLSCSQCEAEERQKRVPGCPHGCPLALALPCFTFSFPSSSLPADLRQLQPQRQTQRYSLPQTSSPAPAGMSGLVLIMNPFLHTTQSAHASLLKPQLTHLVKAFKCSKRATTYTIPISQRGDYMHECITPRLTFCWDFFLLSQFKFTHCGLWKPVPPDWPHRTH